MTKCSAPYTKHIGNGKHREELSFAALRPKAIITARVVHTGEKQEKRCRRYGAVE